MKKVVARAVMKEVWVQQVFLRHNPERHQLQFEIHFITFQSI
jgi:hypothetical protein